MNSYIGKELNFSHCKVIVFSEDFAKNGIESEICALINNEELRPSTNIIVSTSDANTYLKNSNPNIEKLVTNYYDTFELTSNFTGYSDDATIGTFFTKLFGPSKTNTAILGRTFQKISSSEASSEGESSSSSNFNENAQINKTDSDSQEASQSSVDFQNGESGKSSGGNNIENDSGGASLEISGQRGTQNVGIGVFKYGKYIGRLSELDSICHLLITSNVDSFVLSIPIENYADNLIDLNISLSRNTDINVDVSSDYPNISLSVYCEAKILTVDENSNYTDSKTVEDISKSGKEYLKKNIESYLTKTSKELNADIDCFSNYAMSHFLTSQDWKNYNWISKYENANFEVNIEFNITSSLLFSGSQ